MLPDLVGRSRYWFELGRAIWGGCILYDFYYYVYYYRGDPPGPMGGLFPFRPVSPTTSGHGSIKDCPSK